jgi:hypothetical protein
VCITPLTDERSHLSTIFSCNAGFLDKHANDIVALLLEVLPAYTLRPQQEAVNQLVRLAVQQEAFLKPLAAAIIRQAASKPPPQTAFVLLEWSSFVLSELQPANAQKAVRKLLEEQGVLLDSIWDGQRHWKASARVMRGMLRSNPELVVEALQVAAAGSSPGLTRALLEAVAGTPNQQAASEILLPVLCEKVIGGRDKPSPHTLAAYGPLLAALSSEDFSQKLLPAALRALRRTPEPAMHALAGLLPSLTADISGCVSELVTVLLQQLRAKEAVRPAALVTLSAAAARVGDPVVLEQLVKQVAAVLDGSAEGKVKVAAERAALAAAMGALAAAAGGPGGSGGAQDRGAAAGATATNICCKLYQEECK